MAIAKDAKAQKSLARRLRDASVANPCERSDSVRCGACDACQDHAYLVQHFHALARPAPAADLATQPARNWGPHTRPAGVSGVRCAPELRCLS